MVSYADQMSRVPLQTLPAFCTVARLGHIRAAADQLHLTHSAVSQQIKTLEGQLGFELFHRRGRGIVLNPAGQALLSAVEQGLRQIELGVRSAATTASGAGSALRLSAVPSFANRWLLPRMSGWRRKHPDFAIELHASQQFVDLLRDGFHAAIRQGIGPWRDLHSERLISSPLIALGTPEAARRLRGQPTAALAQEPLLGDAAEWARWFALDVAAPPTVRPVASFNDVGLMLQAAEQGLGVTLARDLLAADALRDGRLVRLSTLSLPGDSAQPLWLVYPLALRDWPPLNALRDWLKAELALSDAVLKRLSSRPPLRLDGAGAEPADGKRRRARSS